MNKAKFLIIATFATLLYSGLLAQDNIDKALLLSPSVKDTAITYERKVNFGLAKDRSLIVQYNPLTLSLSGLMYAYQQWISPQVSSDCLFKPSCSEYSKLLFKEYGLFGGIITTADRLMRCDRISATTIDPISVDENDGKVHEDATRYRIGIKNSKP
jgi:putative membrane protein insertion efficiency factor